MSVRVQLRVFVFLLSGSVGAMADDAAVSVSVEFPNQGATQVSVTYEEVVKLTGDKLPYTVEFWVRGAFAKAGLSYSVSGVAGAKAVTAIAAVANDATTHWVYYVNGVLSPYHIDSQSSEGVQTIRFVLEPVHDR